MSSSFLPNSVLLTDIIPGLTPPQGISLKKRRRSGGSINVFTLAGTRKGKTLAAYIKDCKIHNIAIDESHIWCAARQFVRAINWLSFHAHKQNLSLWIHVQSLCLVDGLPWFDTYGPPSAYLTFRHTAKQELLDFTLSEETFSNSDLTWCLGLFLSSMCLLKEPKDILDNIVSFAQQHSFINPELICSHTYSPYLNSLIRLCLTCDPTKRPDIGILGLLVFSKQHILTVETSEHNDVEFLQPRVTAPSVSNIPLPAIVKTTLNLQLDSMVACILQHRNDAFQRYIPWLEDYSIANYAMFMAYKARNIELGRTIIGHMTELGHPPPSYPIHPQETNFATNLMTCLLKVPHTTLLSESIVDYIKENADDIGIKYLSTMSLNIAAMTGISEYLDQLLLEIGFYKYVKTTPLMSAALSGQLETALPLMILAGLQDGTGVTALMTAASRGFVSVVELLKDKEAKMTNSVGQTALMLAAQANHLSVVVALAPFESTMISSTGMTALMYAAQGGYKDIIMALVDYEKGIKSKAGQTALIRAVISGQLKNLQSLLSEARLQDNGNNTALMHAVINGKSKYISPLFPLEAQIVDSNLWTATMHAVNAQQYSILEGILDLSKNHYPDKSELGMYDRHGNTALIIALFLNHFRAVQLLLQYEWENDSLSGDSVFEITVMSCDTKIIEFVYAFYKEHDLLNRISFDKVFLLSLKRRNICYPLLLLKLFSSRVDGTARLLFSIIDHGIVPSLDSELFAYFPLKYIKSATVVLTFLELAATADQQKSLSLQLKLDDYSHDQQIAILFGALSRHMTGLASKVLEEMCVRVASFSIAAVTDHSGRSLLMAAIEADNAVGLSAILALLPDPLSVDCGSALLNHGISYLAHNSMQVICDYLLEHNIRSSVKSREGFTNHTKTQFINAVTKRDKEKVLELRTTDVSQNHPYNSFNILWNSETGCRSALMAANANVVATDLYKYLLCNMGIRSMDNFTALQDACLLANWDVIRYFIFEKEISGMTWLMIYAAVGDTEQVKNYLDEAGRRAGFDYTALIYAARNGHTDCVKLLAEIEAGGTTTTGRTALFWALLNGYDDCAEILYSKEHEICDNKKQTPLMAAATGGSVLFVSKMVDTGLFTDSVDLNGETALMKAADANKPECVEILMLKTNNLRKTTDKGMTALMFAAATDATECIKKLIPAEAGMRDARGSTALMYAASNGKLEAVRMLLEHEGGLLANDGVTALFLAGIQGHLECVKLLYLREYPVLVRNNFNLVGELSTHLSELVEMSSREDLDINEYDNENYEMERLIPNLSSCIEYLLTQRE
ncbi:Protein 21.1 [Giardia lamblia P15]|uniref:Protein 21.1 n=1 Tax=Giardia intestinalis (strain P15) TaxID=658858 RepID=E1F8K7_GIAIA|nr:Protein 21.1 [Giardia lamblia P15]